MTFQEKKILQEELEKFVKTLDLDEGIRIENDSNMIFLNKTGKRYCINLSTKSIEDFFYREKSLEVLEFLKEKMNKDSRIFVY